MPKKPDTGGQAPLSSYWMPPERLEGSTNESVGDPRTCLATTFEFDASFFEAELLPRFLGLKFDQTENEPSFIVEREEHLAEVSAAVLVDASRFDAGQTTLRWDQIPLRVPGGLLHAKVTVLRWDRLVRAIVGSANLTRSGYRRNREVFAALDFWDSADSVPISLLDDILDLLAVSLEWACTAPAVRERTMEAIDDIRRDARRWGAAPREFKPRERPRAALAVTRPRSARSPARSALSDVFEEWRPRRASSVSVVTPFVGQDSMNGTPDRVVEKLKEISRATRDCAAFLVVPEAPRNDRDETTRVELPAAFGRSWQAVFTPSRAFVLPLPLCVDGKESCNRDLHAKAILLESEDDTLLAVGSSNFTPHGMGIGVFNIEANLLFIDRADNKVGGVSLSDRLALPLDWTDAQSVDDLFWQEPARPPADEPEHGAAPPPFFAWASFHQQTGELVLELDHEQREPRAWRASLTGSAGTASLVIFSSDGNSAPRHESPLRYQVSEPARGVGIVALVIDWTGDDGQSFTAKLGVCAETRESLLPPSEFRELGADAIIDCLISGKSPAQWYDQQQRAICRAKGNGAAVESLRSVDTSGYLLYRVRRFGRALAAMRERIEATPPRIDSIRYRLLVDPFGPVPLAERFLEPACGAEPTTAGRLDGEHRFFLVAELLLTVGLLQHQFRRMTRGKDRERIAATFCEAERRLTQLLDSEANCPTAVLPDNLKAYVAAIQAHIGGVTPVVAQEVGDAG